jgi:hypothetical protein
MCWFMGVYVLVHGCVCASHADEMKNGGRLKNMCQQNANPDNKEELQPSCAARSLTRPRLSDDLADTPCIIYHGSDV